MSQTVNEIIQWQRGLANAPAATALEPAASRTLAWGCVDARINTRIITRSDGALLFPDGKSLVRNISARIVGPGAPDGKEEAALLRRAIETDDVNRIVIMGHSECGGINACFHNQGGPALRKYLSSLDGLYDEVKRGRGSDAEKLRRLEVLSVLDSAANLRKHDVVRKAEAEGKLTIETYLLDTGAQRAIDLGKGEDYSITTPAPRHEPKMLVVCSRDSHLFAQEDLNLSSGRALIYRTDEGIVHGAGHTGLQEAAIIEFALANQVEDIVVLGKTRVGEPAQALQQKIAQSVRSLEGYAEVGEAQERGLKVHGWVVDEASRAISEVDKDTCACTPLAQRESHARASRPASTKRRG